MRSDREEIPEGFTKEQADETEMMEARSQKQARTSRAAPGCQEYWPAPFQVCGAIRDKYNSLGAQFSFLLLPTSNELTSPDGHGKFTTFMNGPIYWSAAGGAHPVVNSFLNRWGAHGYETGWMGYPTTDEIVHADGIGRRQEFQNGAIYVSVPNAIGSSIGGAIRDKWNTLGAETPGSVLGYPISDEIVLPDGQGRMNRFERGVIYWHPSTGAHEVTGPILQKWSSEGYEGGPHGYPTASPQITDVRWVQSFQHGEITGYTEVIAQIADLLQISNLDEVYQAGKAVIEEAGLAAIPGFDAVLERAQGSYDAVQAELAAMPPADPTLQDQSSDAPITSRSGNTSNCNWVRPGNNYTNRGDLFYSAAVRFRVLNHGHNGIFVKNDKSGLGGVETVEAVGAQEGVQRLNSATRIGVCRPVYLSVKTDVATRNAAATFAEAQVGKDYNGNFVTTRAKVYSDSYNCSQLVWAAYKHASDGGLDVGEAYPYQPWTLGVYPVDIRNSHNTVSF